MCDRGRCRVLCRFRHRSGQPVKSFLAGGVGNRSVMLNNISGIFIVANFAFEFVCDRLFSLIFDF